MRLSGGLIAVVILVFPVAAAFALDGQTAARIDRIAGPPEGAVIHRAGGSDDRPKPLSLLMDGDSLEVTDTRTQVVVRVSMRARSRRC